MLKILQVRLHQYVNWELPDVQVGFRKGRGTRGHGTPLQYSCLENSLGGGAWWTAVHGVAKSQTRLSIFTFTFHFHTLEKEMATHSQGRRSLVGCCLWGRTWLKRLSSSSSSSSSSKCTIKKQISRHQKMSTELHKISAVPWLLQKCYFPL